MTLTSVIIFSILCLAVTLGMLYVDVKADKAAEIDREYYLLCENERK